MIYVHVPFCQSRCIYCDFYSTVNNEAMRQAYVSAVCAELAQRKRELTELSVSSVYFGGGTPTLLSPNQLGRMLDSVRTYYCLDSKAEITIEGNPDDITPDLAHELASIGFNRVSLGVQSFHDETLRLLGRRHDAHQAVQSVEWLVQAGFDNVSIDLMYGLPRQDLKQWGEDLQQALSLPIKHLSAYALSVEPGTPIERKISGRQLDAVTEDLYLAEFEMLMNETLKKGFKHYEISNFALEGFHSRHNTGYWKQKPYVGVGPGACSFDGSLVRRTNRPYLNCYVHQEGHPHFETEHLSQEECFNEWVFTSLRTSGGLSLKNLASRFPDDWVNELLQASRNSIDSGHLELTENGILRLTRSGLFVSNDVMSDLMRV